MNAELKAKWIEALRSGKYRQAREQLVDNGAFCCLGVLADVRGYQWPTSDTQVPGVCAYWPDPIQDVLTESQSTRLTELNDDENKSFPEIADYIEREIPAETSNDTGAKS